MRIGIDIDGVLTDIEQWQLDYGSKFYFEKYNKQILDNEGYETTDIFKVDANFYIQSYYYLALYFCFLVFLLFL